MAGRTGLYPGSFDPVTYGHVDLIRRSLSLVDRLVVAVLPNAGKAALLPLPEREALLRAVLDHDLERDGLAVLDQTITLKPIAGGSAPGSAPTYSAAGLKRFIGVYTST